MGLDFRGGNYRRYIRFGKRTIKAGEAAAVWNMNGTQTEIIGPRLVRLFYSNIRFLDRFSAKSEQYLVVNYVDGRTEHIAGPVTMFLNPVHHRSVAVKDFVRLLSPNDCCVVYTKVHNALGLGVSDVSDVEAKKISGLQMKTLAHGDPDPNSQSTTLLRRCIKGPHSFMPSIYDTVHTFKWGNSTDPFSVLKTSWDFSDLSIPLKTSDNCDATVKLHVQVQIEDAERLIDAVEDLPAAVNKLLKSDLVNIGSGIKYDQINSKLQSMSDNGGFTNLEKTVRGYGCKIAGVQYLGYVASELMASQFKSSSLGEKAKAAREEAKKEEMEAYRRGEEMERLKLRAARERVEKEQELEEMKAEFTEKLIKKKERGLREVEAERVKARLESLKALKEIGVDLNEFLKDGKGDRGSLGDVIGKMGKGGDAIIKRIELGLAGGGDGDGFGK